MRTIEVFIDSGGAWRWRMRARNGRKIATSGESFSSERAAWRAARMIAGMMIFPVRLRRVM